MKTDINIREIKNLNPTIKAFLNSSKSVVKLNDGFIFRNPFFYDSSYNKFQMILANIDSLRFILKTKYSQIKVNDNIFDGYFFHVSTLDPIGSIDFSLEHQVMKNDFCCKDIDNIKKDTQIIIVDEINDRNSISFEQLETLMLLLQQKNKSNYEMKNEVRNLLEVLIYKNKFSKSHKEQVYLIDLFKDFSEDSKSVDLCEFEQISLDLSLNDVCDEIPQENIYSDYYKILVDNENNITKQFSNIIEKEIKREAMRKIFNNVSIYDASLLSLSSNAVVDFFVAKFDIKKLNVLFENKLVELKDKYKTNFMDFLKQCNYDFSNMNINDKLRVFEELTKLKSSFISDIAAEFKLININLNDNFTKMFINLIKKYVECHIEFWDNDDIGHSIRIYEYSDELNNNFCDLYSLINDLISNDDKGYYAYLKDYNIVFDNMFVSLI